MAEAAGPLPTVVFLGGNGHSAARLEPVRDVLRRPDGRSPFELAEVSYPGFEERPRPPDLEAFLAGTAAHAERLLAPGGPRLAYATGIGGLVALCLRARGGLEVPLVLQAPVLWGLERRWMPRVVRGAWGWRVLSELFAWRPFQAWFARRHFQRPPSPRERDRFFAGYYRCQVAADLFRWMGPPLLRQLEADLARRPAALGGITVWWGARDRVVGVRELAWTERALGVSWPLRVFDRWGHYPMVDDPEGWVLEVGQVLAEPPGFE